MRLIEQRIGNVWCEVGRAMDYDTAYELARTIGRKDNTYMRISYIENLNVNAVNTSESKIETAEVCQCS